MKHNVIRASMIVLLIGLSSMGAGRAFAQGDQNKRIELLSHSWGIASGQVARVSLAHFGDGSVRFLSHSIARIQILNMEGEVIAESDEIRVEPGKIRFWDVPRERLPGGEPNGRIQVRTRILLTVNAVFIGGVLSEPSEPPFGATLELLDAGTGRTAAAIDNLANFQRFLAPPVPVSP